MYSFLSRSLVQLLLVIVFAGSLSAERLRIATYNVRNYLVMDRQVGSSWRPSYPKPEKEKAGVREVIHEAEPDILVLQEMGSVDFLEQLRSDLHQEGLHYPYAVHMQGADTDRHVAVLSKVAPLDVKKHKYLDFKYLERRERVKRGLLEVTFAGLDGKPFRLFALHLKSRWTEDSEDPESVMRRTREAEACRNLIIKTTIDKDLDRFMVVGDFNAPPNSAPLRRFYRRGDLEFGTSLPAYDSRGEIWTYFYKKGSSYQCVDGFVLSNGLLPFAKNGVIVDTESSKVASDHRLVYADFNFGLDSKAAVIE